MKIWIGKSIIAIGILKSILGFLIFHDVFYTLYSEHLFNTIMIAHQPDREAAFWFLYTGFAVTIIGGLVNWIELSKIDIPVFLSWSFLAIIILGVLIMPVSGFWVLLIPTVGLFRLQRKRIKV